MLLSATIVRTEKSEMQEFRGGLLATYCKSLILDVLIKEKVLKFLNILRNIEEQVYDIF